MVVGLCPLPFPGDNVAASSIVRTPKLHFGALEVELVPSSSNKGVFKWPAKDLIGKMDASKMVSVTHNCVSVHGVYIRDHRAHVVL